GIFAQRYDSAGNPVGAEFQVNTYTTDGQMHPAVEVAVDGSFVVVWQSYGQDGDEYGIVAKRYDSAGNPVGSEFQVNSYVTDWQRYPALAVAGDGSFVVGWRSDGQDGDGWGIFAQRYDTAGNPAGGEFQANNYTTSNQTYPDLGVADDGSFVVVWMSDGQDGDEWGIFGQRYDSTGIPTGGEFQVNSYTMDIQGWPAVAMDGDGSFVIAWTSRNQDGDVWGIFAKRYDSAGNPLSVVP
ncbi:flagellar hook associated protein, partial [Myxococcota bacterium]